MGGESRRFLGQGLGGARDGLGRSGAKAGQGCVGSRSAHRAHARIGMVRRRASPTVHRRAPAWRATQGPASAAAPLRVKVEDEYDVWVPHVSGRREGNG